MGGERMSLIRRRLMPVHHEAEKPFEPFPVSPWTLKSTITSNGQEVINNPAAVFGAICQTYYPMKQGDQIVRTKQNVDDDGTALTLWVHEYKGIRGQQDWLRRTYILYGNPLTIGADTKYVRFCFAYNSSTGKTMTQSIVAKFFAVSCKEG